MYDEGKGMLRIAICDDEELIVSQMENIILDICKKENIPYNIEVFYSGEALEKAVLSGSVYDLIYFDILMDGEDGITAAENIRIMDENALFIFVSGYDRYMGKLFPLDVFAFINKPIDAVEFAGVFLRANRKIGDKNYYFLFNYKSEEFKIVCKDILYFESNDRKICIKLRNGSCRSFYGKLSEIETEMAEGKIPFLRIHQSYLVNYHHIKSRTKTSVTLINDVVLPISEDRQKSFSKEYKELVGGEING